MVELKVWLEDHVHDVKGHLVKVIVFHEFDESLCAELQNAVANLVSLRKRKLVKRSKFEAKVMEAYLFIIIV